MEHMGLHGRLADPELLPYLLVARPTGDKLQNLDLAVAQGFSAEPRNLPMRRAAIAGARDDLPWETARMAA